MQESITKTLSKARPKLKALLRTTPFYSTPTLINQFKTHILPILESSTSAIYQATTTALQPIDHLQVTFLHAINTTATRAFLDFNFAPTNLRRDIAMLGLLHKIALQQAHPDLLALIPLATTTPHTHETRLATKRHDKQLHEHCDGTHTELMARSIFALTTIYNKLPQHVIDAKTISTFPSKLTSAARANANGT